MYQPSTLTSQQFETPTQAVQEQVLQSKRLDKVQLGQLPIKLDDISKRYMNPGELETLATLVARVKPKRMIEFGCNEGRTAKVMLREFPIQSYVGVDVLPGYQFTCKVQSREVPKDPGHLAMHDHRFQLLLRARGTWDLTPDDLRQADVIFIDGDHSYDAVMHDTILASKVVNPGGLIVWHDYHDRGTVQVKEVLEQLHARGRKIRHVEGTWLAYEHH